MSVIKLPTVESALPGDSVLDCTGENGTPALNGRDSESLACGSCGDIIGKNVSTRTVYERFASETGRLLIKCGCGTLNKLNVTKISKEDSGRQQN